MISLQNATHGHKNDVKIDIEILRSGHVLFRMVYNHSDQEMARFEISAGCEV